MSISILRYFSFWIMICIEKVTLFMAEIGERSTIFTKQSSGPGALTLNTESAALKKLQCQMSWNLGCSAQFQQDRAGSGLEQSGVEFPWCNCNTCQLNKDEDLSFPGCALHSGILFLSHIGSPPALRSWPDSTSFSVDFGYKEGGDAHVPGILPFTQVLPLKYNQVGHLWGTIWRWHPTQHRGPGPPSGGCYLLFL